MNPILSDLLKRTVNKPF